MLVFTHFGISFYSYFFSNRSSNLYKDDSKKLLFHSSVVGVAGILPDLLSIHLTLNARYSSFTHTIWFPLIFIFISFLLIFVKKIPNRLIFWIPLAISIHLFLDAISGGIIPIPSTQKVVGDYYIEPHYWVIADMFFMLCLYLTFKKVLDVKSFINKLRKRNL